MLQLRRQLRAAWVTFRASIHLSPLDLPQSGDRLLECALLKIYRWFIKQLATAANEGSNGHESRLSHCRHQGV